MQPLIFNLGWMELVIILAIVLLLFGGSRLAGLGKSTGRALKEFKEETKGLKGDSKAAGEVSAGDVSDNPAQPTVATPPDTAPAAGETRSDN